MGQGSGQAFSTAGHARLHRGPPGGSCGHCDLLERATAAILFRVNEAFVGLSLGARPLSSRNADPEAVP